MIVLAIVIIFLFMLLMSNQGEKFATIGLAGHPRYCNKLNQVYFYPKCKNCDMRKKRAVQTCGPM